MNHLSSGQTLGVKAQRFRGHTSPHRNVKEKKLVSQMQIYDSQYIDEDQLNQLSTMHAFFSSIKSDVFQLEKLPYGYFEAVQLFREQQISERKNLHENLNLEIIDLFKQMEIEGNISDQVENGFLFDVFVQLKNDQKIAVSFDDTSMYFWWDQEKPMGRQVLRTRVLKNTGYNVISIIKQKWEKMSKEEKLGYLRIQINNASLEQNLQNQANNLQTVEIVGGEGEDEDEEGDELQQM
eukprot:TRINITY_DN1247_c0_g2_i1.p3 TRINITY_DN1247_c0_g2~~TRINITY_DN1247_c0_g2_i1.p3  ORF type:complete len:237 (+),score=45.93 TRINITY_DN1247_c0_g2_i1:1566-2276(+)